MPRCLGVSHRCGELRKSLRISWGGWARRDPFVYRIFLGEFPPPGFETRPTSAIYAHKHEQTKHRFATSQNLEQLLLRQKGTLPTVGVNDSPIFFRAWRSCVAPDSKPGNVGWVVPMQRILRQKGRFLPTSRRPASARRWREQDQVRPH